MTLDVESRLSRYGDALERRIDPIDIADLDSLVSSQLEPPVPVSRGWKVALLAATVVLFAGVILMVAARLGSESIPPVTEPEPTVVEEPLPVTEPEPTVVDGTGGRWEQIPLDPSVFTGARLHDVIGDGDLLVVGSDAAGQATVWVSEDGVGWQTFGLETEVWELDIARRDRDFLLVGSGPGGLTFWQSEDARKWTQLAGASGSFDDRLRFEDVTLWPVGPWVLLGGYVVDTCVTPCQAAEPGVWASQDLEAWTRLDSQSFGQVSDELEIRDIESSGPFIVAVGFEFGRPAVFTSQDALIWEPVPSTSIVQEDRINFASGSAVMSMQAVAYDGRIYVAVGSSYRDIGADQSDAWIWTSEDGLSWPGRPIAEPDVWDTELKGIEFIDGTWVAYGGTDQPDPETGTRDGNSLIWTSDDANVWQSQFVGFFVDSIVNTDSGLVAIGSICTEPEPIQCQTGIWRYDPDN